MAFRTTQKSTRVALLIVSVLFIVGGVWAVVSFSQPESGQPETDIDSSVVEEVESAVAEAMADEEVEEQEEEETTSVGEAIPDTSPTENTNPFEGTYKNPFE